MVLSFQDNENDHLHIVSHMTLVKWIIFVWAISNI